MGRTGVLTPVAIFKPVDTGDSIIERASLHNLSVLYQTLGELPKINQPIWVIKSNMIIPQIIRSIKNDDPNDNVLFEHIKPEYCPICGGLTKVVVSSSGVLNVVCDNPECEGKLANRVDHFLGKKGLDVKGISMATIEKLIDWGWKLII